MSTQGDYRSHRPTTRLAALRALLGRILSKEHGETIRLCLLIVHEILEHRDILS